MTDPVQDSESGDIGEGWPLALSRVDECCLCSLRVNAAFVGPSWTNPDLQSRLRLKKASPQWENMDLTEFRKLRALK
jgi:hypothetical protein